MKKQATIFDYARFMKEYCKNQQECDGCPLMDKSTGMLCDDFIREHSEEANENILKWCEKHPVKTRQDKFLEMFPNAVLVNDEVIGICPDTIDGQYGAICNKLTCDDCRRKYWLAEVDE